MAKIKVLIGSMEVIQGITSIIIIVCVVMLLAYWLTLHFSTLRAKDYLESKLHIYENPPPKKLKEPYSFLNVCSYKQLKILFELFPPEEPIMLEDVGDLFDFKRAVKRQLHIVEMHIKNSK